MIAIILAGGKGTRMKCDVPKCVVPLRNKPMISYLIASLKKLGIEKIYVVVGHKKEEVKKYITDDVIYIEQKKPLGTADAVKSCQKELQKIKDDVLILAADMPLVKKETLADFIQYHQHNLNDLTILSTNIDNPLGFGRIIRTELKEIKIIEEQDLKVEEQDIKEVNTSIYCIKSQVLTKNINAIQKHKLTGEYYLTDLVALISSKYRVDVYNTKYSYHLQGINDYETLKKVEQKMEEACGN